MQALSLCIISAALFQCLLLQSLNTAGNFQFFSYACLCTFLASYVVMQLHSYARTIENMPLLFAQTG